MLTGMLAVRSMVLGERHDLWEVNADREYHEEVRGAGRTAPEMGPVEEELTRVFMRIDRVALGLAAGAVGGLGLFLATLVLVLRGGPVIGPTLGLLGQYFPGYSVTAWGSLVGLFYGYVSGFAARLVVRNATQRDNVYVPRCCLSLVAAAAHIRLLVVGCRTSTTPVPISS